MTDYYAVLKRAIGGLEHESADVRRSIYEKARAALLGQLKAIDPPLPPAEISRQRLELEEAIRRVEREAAMTAAGPSPARVRAAAAAADAMAAEAMRLPEDDAAFDGQGSETSSERSAPAVAPPRPRTTPVPADFRAAEAVAARPPLRTPRAPVVPAPPPPASQERAPAFEPEEQPRRRNAAPSPRREPTFQPEPEPAQEETEYAGEPVEPIDAEERAEWPEDGNDEALLNAEERPPRRERRKPRRPETAAVTVERARPRSRSLVIIGVVALVVVVAVGVVWAQRGKVNDVIGGLISSHEPASGPNGDASSGSDAANGKNADRLGDAAPAESPKSVRTVTAEPPPEGSEPDPLAGVVQPSESPPAATPETTPPAAPSASAPAPAVEATSPEAAATEAPQTEAPATTAPGDATAQKAILYEQPLDGSSNVTALQANVTWSFAPNTSNGPEIVANVEVPDRQMKVTVNIRKNNDTALPASHLVEVIIDTPADFPGGGVKAVPAFVMKPTEEARGVPLDGAAAKVADGFFWIAFAGDAAPMAQNVALMRERNWIDIPLVYNNDQRAILTLEKGTAGQAAFTQALTAWGND